MSLLVLILFFGVSFVLSSAMVPVFKRMLEEAGFVRKNYRGESIPVGVGLVFVISSSITVLLARNFNILSNEAYIFMFMIGAMAFFGLVDDVFGTRHATGLSGHFKKMLLNREVTTGAMKAFAGGVIALSVSLEISRGTGDLWNIIINSFIIALSTNMINLLDLRPGRAGKGFFVFAFFIMVFGQDKPELLYLSIMMGGLAAIMPSDLKAYIMMGDVGSNTLGITMGYTASVVLPAQAKAVYLFILLALHLLTEKYSLTGIIEKNRVLSYLDMIGRKN